VSFRVHKIWAFLSVDPADNVEGIIWVLNGDTWMPLIAANQARLVSLREKVDEIMPELRRRGATVQLASFDVRTNLEVIK
jgi:hypothetical protein